MIKEYKTINGELIIKREENVIVAEFIGTLDLKIAIAFKNALLELTKPLQGQKWAYLSLSPRNDAATPEAEEVLVECLQLAWSLGCVAGAYVLKTNLTIDQVDRMLKKAGLATGIQGKIFNSAEEARQSVNNALTNV